MRGVQHWILEPQQREEAGSIVAQAQFAIWKNIAVSVIHKFREVTGHKLKKGIKLLFRAKVRFHEVYGLSFGIQEIDPAYTVGEFAAKLARIREQFRREALTDPNRALSTPAEFVRVAFLKYPSRHRQASRDR